MKVNPQPPYLIQSVSEQHRLLGLPGPTHPLISLVNFADVPQIAVTEPIRFSMHFYTITLKQGCACKVRYGQQYYDFEQGVMSFIGPSQVITWEVNDAKPTAGWLLVMHPDLLRHHALGQKIKTYGFFNYSLHEALHLSEVEEALLDELLTKLNAELAHPIDSHSEEVLLAHLDLLLSYVNRFYDRQFTTRKLVNTDLLTKLDRVLAAYINSDQLQELGLPTVGYVSAQLNLSPHYLSDMLRTLTGQTTQQHIHYALLERAKELLSSSSLSISEIAYYLGFEHPQSFSKLFKTKTKLTPLAFRQSFN